MYMPGFVEECSYIAWVCAHLGFPVHTVLGVSNCYLLIRNSKVVYINVSKFLLREYPIIDVEEEGEVAHDTAVCIYMWLFKVCSTELLQTPILLGGPGVIVQIDESLFGTNLK